MSGSLIHVLDSRLAESLSTIEHRIDKPVRVAAWGVAGASLFSAAAAACGAVAAAAGAYIAVRSAIRISTEHEDDPADREIDISDPLE